MSDTDTELIALLAKLRKLQNKLADLESKQAAVKESLVVTQTQADELRRKSKEKHSE